MTRLLCDRGDRPASFRFLPASRIHALLLPLTLLAGTAEVRAQAAAAAAPETAASASMLPPVRAVEAAERATGPVQGYRAGRAQGPTKTDTPLAETPQSVTVVTRDQIVDQGATNVQDALNYAAGVRSDAYGLDSRSDGARIRGGTPDEYLDGLRKLFNYYTSNARTEPYTLERIEVLRGPASLLYGQGTTGGLINLVSKRPQAEAQGEVGLQLGSWHRRQLQADLTGPLTADQQWLYRVVALVRDADTQVDDVRDDRRLFAPSLTWQPSAATRLTLQGLWQRDRSGSTSQFFPWSGTVSTNPNGQLPTRRYIGQPGWDRYDTDRESFGWLLEHRFSDRWQLRQNVRWARNKVDYRSVYGDAFSGGWVADPVNQRLLGRYAYADLNKVRMLTADQHLQGELDVGGTRHQLLLGVDSARYRQAGASAFDSPTYAGGTVPLIDAYAPVYPAYTPPALADKGGSGQRQLGVYVQDQVSLGRWILVAGLRHDTATAQAAGTPDQKSQATSKRLGALYKLAGGWSPYLSYSESFTPQSGISGPLRPLRGKQWEAGVKVEPAQARWAFNAAAYRVVETDRISEPAPNVIVQLPQTWARGVELEAKGRVAPQLDLIANLNFIGLDPQLENMPDRQASLWARYAFALAGVQGFSAGAGWRHGSGYADGAAPRIPAVNLLDLMLAWEASHWRLALNVNNATDRAYVATCLSRGDCWWGARRNAVASVTYRW